MTAQRNVASDLLDLNAEVCRRLWHMAGVGTSPAALAPHLIYPSCGSKDRRVSEQEARFAFAELLTTSPYYYSVETPTDEKHRRTGTRTRSAMSDMSLYLPADSGLRKVVNVELKGRNPAPDDVAWDVKKIVLERRDGTDVCGNWFGLLESAKWATFRSLFGKFRNAFSGLAEQGGVVDTTGLSLVVCFCVLGRSAETGWACQRHLQFADPIPLTACCDAFGDIVSSEDLKQQLSDAGWTVLCGGTP